MIYDQDISVPESPEEMLRELEDAIREKPEFLKGRRISDPVGEAYLAEIPDAKQLALLKDFERGRRAARRMEKMVWHLGDARHEPAIRALIKIWVDGALPTLHTTTGHALFAMHSNEARKALESTIDRDDHFCRFIGIKAIFDGAPDRAYERFEKLFTGVDPKSQELAQEVLQFLCPSARQWEDGKAVFIWTEPRVRDWLKCDLRWLDLCARLRRHPSLGRGAREVLRHVDPSHRSAALERVRADELPGEPELRTKRSGDLLRRFRNGEFNSVWDEIRSHQRIGGAFREEVMDVADATMKRVARNADLIAGRLENLGWRALSGKLRTLPSPDDRTTTDRIVAMTGGPIPSDAVGILDGCRRYRLDLGLPIRAGGA